MELTSGVIRGVFSTVARLAAMAVFAISGAQAQDTGEDSIDRVMVIVNNDVITQSEFESRLRQLRYELSRAEQQDGQPPAMPPEEILREQLMERLIVESIQLQMAERGGIEVTEPQMDAAIGQIARSNGMSAEQLRVQMWREGVDYDDFRAQMRRQLILRQLLQAQVESRVRISETDIDEFLAQVGERGVDTEYNLAHILIRLPESATAQQVQATGARAAEALTALHNGMSFTQAAITYSESEDALEGGALGWRKLGQLPAIFVDALAGLPEGSVTDIIRSENGFHILKLIEKRGLGAETIVKTHARHILIQANSELGMERAIRQLESVRQRILDGEDFAVICRALSDDPVSATKGGDLGWLAPGDTVPAFESAMDQLPLNTLSQPVVSQYGVHLIEVLERRSEDAGDLLVRRKAAEQLHARKTDEQYGEWLRQLRDEAYVEQLL